MTDTLKMYICRVSEENVFDKISALFNLIGKANTGEKIYFHRQF